jgi:flavin reductase (DIM6/NTAB) family NADH-FMN oxidoreductase RutF
MYFRPGKHKEAGLSFSPIKAIISPRPIGWISSRGKGGSVNLAPYSYFNAISEQPPMVIFSSAPSGNSGHKDSLRNVIETKEFVVNIVSNELGNAMNITSGGLPYGESEFAAANLEIADCKTVAVPRVAASPAALECKLWKVVKLPKPDNADAGIMVVGTITGIHIDDTIIKDGKVDVTAYQPLARLGYMDYARISDVFSMQRPNAK